MFVMLLLTLLAARGWTPMWAAGVCAWLAGMCLWPRAQTAQKRQFSLLVGLGLICAAAAWLLGQDLPVARLLSQNQGLLALLTAVTFLRLLSLPQAEPLPELAPAGVTGYLKTLLGLHLFGAVINLSALVIVGDRLHGRRRLGRAQAVLLSRGFSSAAFWSPFFAAMATALTYAPGANLGLVLLFGIPLAAIALAISVFDAWRRDPERLAGFRGYPMRIESLWLPALLALAVVVAHWRLPDWSVLTLVSLLAPGLAMTTLLVRSGWNQARALVCNHLRCSLADMYGELLLFLGAGVLGAGLIALGAALRGDLPPMAITSASLSLALVLMVGVALLGVHPIVSIAAVTAIFGPQAEPTPMALVFLAAWGIGASAGPLSGIHLLMQGRYGIKGYTMMRWNMAYTLFMTAVALIPINVSLV